MGERGKATAQVQPGAVRHDWKMVHSQYSPGWYQVLSLELKWGSWLKQSIVLHSGGAGSFVISVRKTQALQAS